MSASSETGGQGVCWEQDQSRNREGVSWEHWLQGLGCWGAGWNPFWSESRPLTLSGLHKGAPDLAHGSALTLGASQHCVIGTHSPSLHHHCLPTHSNSRPPISLHSFFPPSIIHLSIQPSVCPSINSSTHLPTHLSVHPFPYLPSIICLSIPLFIFLFIY